MRKLFLIAFSPLIIASIFLMAYYGIVSSTKQNEVFAKEGRDFTIELKNVSPEIVNKLKSGEYSFRYDMTAKQTE